MSLFTITKYSSKQFLNHIEFEKIMASSHDS